MLVRYIALVAFLWAMVVAVAIGSMPAQGAQANRTHPAIAVCSVFGPRDCLDALKVVNCESSFSIDAENGQYLGLFQMGHLGAARVRTRLGRLVPGPRCAPVLRRLRSRLEPMGVQAVSQLEIAARRAWVEWGDGYALWGRCSGCRELRHVRGKRRSWMLCLDCFDIVGPHARNGAHTDDDSNGKEPL